MSEAQLPEQFEDLAPFLGWALQPESARIEKKTGASMDEILAFYNAMMPQIDKILDYLDGYFGAAMPDPVHNLYLLTLSLVEVATLVELYTKQESVEACDPLRFVLQH